MLGLNDTISNLKVDPTRPVCDDEPLRDRCELTYVVDWDTVHVVLQRESTELSVTEPSKLISTGLWNSGHSGAPVSGMFTPSIRRRFARKRCGVTNVSQYPDWRETRLTGPAVEG